MGIRTRGFALKARARRTAKNIKPDLKAVLARLESTGLVRHLEEGEPAFVFKHVLTQESTYETLLHSRRRELHRAVAQTYEAMYGEQLDEFAALLAQHFAEAGEDAKALQYSTRAGDAATRVFANSEALAFYKQALELARRTEPRASAKIRELFLKCGRAFELCGRYRDALTDYREMEQEGHAHADTETELASLMAQATIHAIPTEFGDANLAENLAKRALDLARQIGNESAEAKILWNLLLLNSRLGARYQDALRYGEQSLALARANNLEEQEAFDLNDLGTVYVATGNRERALPALLQARKYWIEHNNLPMLTDNLSYQVMVHLALGEYEKAIPPSQEAYQISQKIGNQWGMAFSRMWVGRAYVELGLVEDALASMTSAISLADQSGFVAPLVFTRAELAQLYGELGLVERGIELANLAVEHLTRSNIIVNALTYGILAQLFLLRGDLDEAERLLNESKAISAGQEPPLQFGAPSQLAQLQFLLARGDYQATVEQATTLVNELRRLDMNRSLPPYWLCLAQALRAQGKLQDAFNVLTDARTLARALNARWRLWLIDVRLAEIETARGNLDSADVYLKDARETIEFIAAHTPAELRESFLNLPDARAALQDKR